MNEQRLIQALAGHVGQVLTAEDAGRMLAAAVGGDPIDVDQFTPMFCGRLTFAAERFHTRFYMIAMLFIVFDIETVFLYPWAVVYGQLGLFGLIEMGIFVAILLAGLVYVWGKGALEWD